MGANVLTHLLGQTVEDLAQKITAYREARAAAGHPGRGLVTLMLHTLVGDDDEEVHDLARKPMMDYLGASFDLASKHLASVPFLKDPGKIDVTQLTPDLAEAALEASFEKYFYMGSLLGSYDKCLATVDRLAQLDVDELACLVDFGVEPQVVLKGLENLNVLRKLANPEPLRAA